MEPARVLGQRYREGDGGPIKVRINVPRSAKRALFKSSASDMAAFPVIPRDHEVGDR